MRLGTAVVVSLLGIVLVTAQTEVRRFRPVTDAMLLKPDPADWPNWRRTLNGWGYSPLNQITRHNVGQLQLAWSWTMQDGADEATPLVYDGIMYLPSPNGVQALDGATGEFIWQFDHTGMARRSIAIHGDKILAATGEAHLIGLDARTGKLVWDQTVADHNLGYKYTSGPIVVKGKVIAGMTGCEKYKEDVCFISAHDPDTGRQLWRTNTVARPGEPGGDTWGDLPLKFRAGSDAWIPGSYDPGTNLIYWGTSQAKPWASAQRGTDGASLYTNSTLALDPDTGKIMWYYQHIPGETHDFDEVYENILVDRDGRQSLFKMGKIGVAVGARSQDGEVPQRV
jgi:alcohol dehydrogenase (cytochrome c)